MTGFRAAAQQIAEQTLVLALLSRLVMRVAAPMPEADPHHAARERASARTMHIGLYLAVIAPVATAPYDARRP